MSNITINRPWPSSFSWSSAAYSHSSLEQIHKLCRNYVASLDLGCSGVKHTRSYPGLSADMDSRERYKLWCRGWKSAYAELSALIRVMKTYRRTVRFPKLTPEQQKRVAAYNSGANQQPEQLLRGLAERHLHRLQETAQVMLNARYNAKLAAAEARRRDLEQRSGPLAKAA